MALERIPILSVYQNGKKIPIPAIRGEQGPQGEPGVGVSILGSYDTYEELIAAHPTGTVGDAYLVVGDLYVWSATESLWKNVGSIRGPQGIQGIQGPPGPNDHNELINRNKPDQHTIDSITGLRDAIATDTTLTKNGYAADAGIVGRKFKDIVDQTLTKDGFAADAGVVGKKIEELSNKLKFKNYYSLEVPTVNTTSTLVKTITIPPKTFYSFSAGLSYNDSPAKSIQIRNEKANIVYYNESVDGGGVSVTYSGYSGIDGATLYVKAESTRVGKNAIRITGFMIEGVDVI